MKMKLTHPFDFIYCSTIEFFIKNNEEVEVYIVEFESDGMNKSYYIERDK